MVTSGGDQWWRPVVAVAVTSGGNQWWSSGANQWWWQVVVTSGDDQWKPVKRQGAQKDEYEEN